MRNSILGVPIENQCVKGGGLLYGGFALLIFGIFCILSVLTFCHICILSNLHFVTDSLITNSIYIAKTFLLKVPVFQYWTLPRYLKLNSKKTESMKPIDFDNII